jgi:cytochrome b involved in lipid metabolism
MDWIRLSGDKSKDLTGFGGPGAYGPVSEEELGQRNSEDNAWIAIRGRVYNITPYLEFHPGGVDEIMRGAGKDGTQLFNEIHKWVNVESMLASCYIGPLKAKTKAKAKARRTHNPNTESKSQIAASPMTLEVPQPTASTLSSCMFHMPFHLASSLNISSLHCWLDFQLLI